MRVDGQPRRTIWPDASGLAVQVIDQRTLPHRLEIATLADLAAVLTAIREMWVRGAPLIGVSAAYGLALQMRRDPSEASLAAAAEALVAARPTAVNLAWAVRRVQAHLLPLAPTERAAAAWRLAGELADEDVAVNEAIGRQGLPLLQQVAARRGGRVNVLTHCNAGWLATVDWGTALSPVYQAQAAGLEVHVWVGETRPRNQGASLTAWELGQQGVAHTVIADNAGGHLMQQGRVDLVIVGCDRVSARGDVCNKIGTYLKALAARDNDVPFYVALPSPTIDWTVHDGVKEIPIEERTADEVSFVQGRAADGSIASVRISPEGSPAANPAFDVTPARLITGLITERGIATPSPEGLKALFPERS